MGVFTATMAVVAAATAGPTPPHPDAASACAAMNVSTLISIMHGEERCTPLPLDHTFYACAHTCTVNGEVDGRTTTQMLHKPTSPPVECLA
jgi:hypothetical protein